MEGMTLVGGFAVALVGLYFVFFHLKEDLDGYRAEEAEDLSAGPVTFHVATANANLVPLALRALEAQRANHPEIQYVLTMGEEAALVEALCDGRFDVVVVSPTVAWLPEVSVCDMTVKPPSILLDEGDIALKPFDTGAQSQKILYRNDPSGLADEFVQALCARGL